MRRIATLLTLAACCLAAAPAAHAGTLNLTKSHMKGGVVTAHGTPEGIDCGLGCDRQSRNMPSVCNYEENPPCVPQTTGIHTTVEAGWRLDGITGCDPEPVESCAVTVSGTRNVRVEYADIQDPALELTAAPANGASVRDTITFTAAASDNDRLSRVELSHPGFSDSKTTGPFTWTVDTKQLVPGQRTFTIKAFDVNGRSRTITRTLTLDNFVPEVGLTGGPQENGLVGGGRVTFQFLATDAHSGVATVACAIEGRPWATCDAPGEQSYDLADGEHRFLVRAVDRSGNTSAVASRRFTMDGTVPQLEITAGPQDGALIGKPGTVQYAFQASDPQSAVNRVECAIDSSYGACDSWDAHAVRDLSDGAHTFSVRAFDTAGNQSVVTRSFTIDVTAPKLALTGGPAEGAVIGRPASPAFPFTVSDATSDVTKVECEMDGKGFGACSGADAHELSGLAHGRHALKVRATDAAGNAATVTRAFEVDVVAPETTIDSASTGASSAFTFSSSEGGSTFQCRLYKAGATPPAFGACAGASGSHSSSGLAVGDYVFDVIGTDALGNTDESPATRAFRVDEEIKPPPPPPPVERIASSMNWDFARVGKRMRVLRLNVTAIPAGATVERSCAGKGCAFKKKSIPFKAIALKLKPQFKKKLLAPGTKIEIRVVKPGTIGKVVVLTIRKKGLPAFQALCLQPGATKPAAC